MRAPLLVTLALLLAGCNGESPPPTAPEPPPVPPVPQAGRVPLEGRPGPVVKRPPLPVPPENEEGRRLALLRLLESGDSEQVRFAQRTLAEDPDGKAVAALFAEVVPAQLTKNAFLVANILGAVSPEGPGPHMAETLLLCMREAKDPQVQRIAVARYAECVEETDAEAIAEVVTVQWSPVALQALTALRGHPDRDRAARALEARLDRIDQFALPAVYYTLGVLGSTGSVPMLVKAIDKGRGGSSTEAGAALSAAVGLAHLGHPGAMEYLRDIVAPLPLDAIAGPNGPEAALSKARDPAMKKRLLAQIEGGRAEAAAAAVALLLEFPLDDDSKRALAVAAGRKEWPPVVEALSAIHDYAPEEARVRTLAMLQEDEWERRYAATLILGRMKDPETAAPLAERLAREEHDGVHRKIVDALGILADNATIPVLLGAMRNDPAETADVAGRAFQVRVNLLGSMADAAVADVESMIEEGVSPAVLPHALRVLGQTPKGDRANGILETHLRHEDPNVRVAAATAMGDRGDRSLRDVLSQQYAREPDDFVASVIHDAVLRLELRNP
ncbi:MAG: HEAT repeat domain-containing protein [Planctomycetota bacterium]|jgi:HEAT repeat protein